MSSLRERIGGLVAKWRKEGASKGSWVLSYRTACEHHAEELAAALAAEGPQHGEIERLEGLRKSWDDLADDTHGPHSFDFRCGVQRCEAELGLLIKALAAEGPGDGLTQKLADSLRDYMRLASDNECVQFGVFGAAKDALAEFEAAAPSLHKGGDEQIIEIDEDGNVHGDISGLKKEPNNE